MAINARIDRPLARLALSATLVVGLALPVACLADDDASGLADLSLSSLLDMPVTGASRFVQRRSQASSAVTVITREEIRALGHRTLADVLRSVRGVVVTSDRNYEYAGVRGFLASGDYTTRVLLLIDGNRVNDAMFDQAFIGTEFPLDLDVVERVEFIPGQGSSVYGANALFGVINVITREADRRGQAGLHLAFGSGGERQLRGTLRLPWGKGGLQIQASRQLSQGEDLFVPDQLGVNDSDGWTRGTDTSRRNALYVRVDQGQFTASFLHADRVKGTPLVVDLVYGDTRNRYGDTYSLLNLEHSLALGDKTRLSTRLFAGRYGFVGDYMIDYPPVTLNRDLSVARWQGAEVRWSHTGWAGHRVMAGTEWQDTSKLLQRNWDVEPAAPAYLDDQRRAWRAAFYLEDQWQFSPGWELHLGARADRTSALSTQISPRAAVVWTPDAFWALKLIHSTAFRPPNAYEAHYVVDAGAGYRSNPFLTKERVKGDEFVAEWRGKSAWRFSTSLYRNHAREMLRLLYDAQVDRYQFANTLDLMVRGVELEAEYAFDGIRLRSNYSRAKLDGAGAAASNFPAQMLKAVGVVPVAPHSIRWSDWTIAAEVVMLSRRGQAPGHGLLNLHVQGPLWEAGPQLSVQLRNAFDRALFDPGIDAARQPVLPLPGRQGRLELNWPLAL